MGKNEYPAWFGDSFREYAFKTFVPETDFRVSSLFIKEGVLKGQQVKASFSFSLKGIVNRGSFVYFERLPVGFHPVLMQYELADFAFTDWTLQGCHADGKFVSAGRGRKDCSIVLNMKDCKEIIQGQMELLFGRLKNDSYLAHICPGKSAESLQEHTAKVVERACWLIGKHGFGEGRRSFDSGVAGKYSENVQEE